MRILIPLTEDRKKLARTVKDGNPKIVQYIIQTINFNILFVIYMQYTQADKYVLHLIF